jgi:hypothetical protein
MSNRRIGGDLRNVPHAAEGTSDGDPGDIPLGSPFAEIARLAATVLRAPLGGLWLSEGDRLWSSAADGLGPPEARVARRLAAEVVRRGEASVFCDASKDASLAQAAPPRDGLRFFAGTPVVAEGAVGGALWVAGPKPRPRLASRDREALAGIARLAAVMVREQAHHQVGSAEAVAGGEVPLEMILHRALEARRGRLGLVLLGAGGGVRGDLLDVAALRLRAQVRPGDAVARLDDATLAVVLVGHGPASGYARRAEQLRGVVADLLGVQAGLGLAVAPDDAATAPGLLRAAERELRRASCALGGAQDAGLPRAAPAGRSGRR